MSLNESAMQSHSLHPPDAVQGFGCSQQVFCRAKRADVYTSALLAGAMKPLNVLPKFENHFANQTVRFQVQLEADGYFSAQKFSSLHPQQAGRVGTNSQFFESVFYKSDFKNTCWASPKPNIQCKNHAERANFLREKRFSKIGVDSFNIASNRNYYFRF